MRGTELAAEGLRGLLAMLAVLYGHFRHRLPFLDTLLDRVCGGGGWEGGEAFRAAQRQVWGDALWSVQRDGEALGALRGLG